MSSLQKPNQTTNNGTNYIDSLPVEILCMVFDGLDLHSVKNASLVCKRWNNIIFYSGYAARFVLTINVWIMYYPDVKEMGKHEIKRLRDTAEYSQRYYRKLNYYSMQLTELTLVSDWYGHGVWPEILNILPKMEKLEVLVFTNVTVLKSNFLCMDTPMNRLRKLEFRRCYLETKLILGLKDKFPNAFINFSNCDMLCVY
ncbi:uncharacterized protein LOC126574360 [Anopheles aquasalis]|uniref:uncharacterized protein LOC126574360 n=1 Tax=Anopheles aquasalis TaxID=42839 RepID=UPI00215B726F|nr:uncharacterized protein LOC126574360 [Anopheles aquasalis]